MKKLLIVAALLFWHHMPLSATNNFPKTIFVPRSQGADWDRYIAGIADHTNKFDIECWYGFAAINVGYNQSFKSSIITDYLFGAAAEKNSIKFSGSRSLQPGQYDIVADYFGLPTDFKSTITFNPRITNIIFDLDFYAGLDAYAEGMYLSLHIPVCATRWHLHPYEQVITPGVNPFLPGYMAATEVANANLPKNALIALNGGTVFGDMQEPLAFGKISPCAKSKTRIADLTFMWGWNAVNCDNYHVGLELRTTFATSNKPSGEFLFEPLAGNGGHMELGLGAHSHLMLWECDSEKFLSFHLYGYVSHLFGTRQTRSFDFKQNGQGSRYILAEQFQPINKFDPNGHLDNAGVRDEYAGSLLPAINLTTLCCNVSNDLQGQLSLYMHYHNCGLSWDLGYSIWGKTQEKVKITDTLRSGKYTLKGDSFIYGTATSGGVTNIVPLSASQQESATWFRGANTNPTLNTAGIAQELNPEVDNAEFATAQINGTATIAVTSQVPPANRNMNTSNGIEYITIEMLNIDSATSPAQFSNKIFTYLGYTWDNIVCNDPTLQGAVPFVGIGAEVEFDGKGCSSSNNCSCRATLNQWSVWGKFGLAF